MKTKFISLGIEYFYGYCGILRLLFVVVFVFVEAKRKKTTKKLNKINNTTREKTTITKTLQQ